jgi:hypothetical protein
MAKKQQRPYFVQLVFLVLLLWFACMAKYKEAVGLAGIGAVLVLGASIVEANAKLIWDQYKASYKPTGVGWFDALNKPTQLYNLLNVWVVWPVVFVLGLWAIWVAYQLG